MPALLAEGEVYLTDAFRSLQAAPPRITVGVSVHGSVLDPVSYTHLDVYKRQGQGSCPQQRERTGYHGGGLNVLL